MMILDTHAWLWWNSESSNLSDSARTAIDRTDARRDRYQITTL
jgi:PIN domain nuclease of toxin-antitoxin system